MKYIGGLLFFAVAFVLGLDEEEKEILKARKQACASEVKVDPDLVEKLVAGDWTKETTELKKFVHCMMMKSDLMSKEGVLKLDVALANVPKEDLFEVETKINSCLGRRMNSGYETAWNYLKCYHVKDPKHSIL